MLLLSFKSVMSNILKILGRVKILFNIFYCFIIFFMCIVSFEETLASNIAQLTVDITHTKPVNKNLFGHALINNDHCRGLKSGTKCWSPCGDFKDFATGFWDPIINKPDRNALAVFRDISLPMLRIWAQGDHNPVQKWYEMLGTKNAEFKASLDNMLRMCEQIQAEPMIVLSALYASGNESADLVEYLNAPNDGSNPSGGIDWASVRAKNGRPEPYHVRYFEFGNEVWTGNAGDIGSVLSKNYAVTFLEHRKKMRAIDPNVQVGLVMTNHPRGSMASWDKVVLETVGGQMDFVITHVYPAFLNRDNNYMSSEDFFKIALAAPDQILKELEEFSSLINSYAGRDVPIAITEYNGIFVQNKPVPYRFSLGNALLNADLLRIFLSLNDKLLCSLFWQALNSYTGMAYTPNYPRSGRYILRPTGEMFKLFGKHFGTQLATVSVTSDGYSSPAFSNTQAAGDDLGCGGEYIVGVSKSQAPIFIPPSAWRTSFFSGVKVEFDETKLHLKFDHLTKPFYHTRTELKLDPRRKYIFKAKAKSSALSRDSGVYLAVGDYEGWDKTLWTKSSEKLIGTVDWIDLEISFTPQCNSKGQNLIIMKKEGLTPCSGDLWIKDAIIEDAGPADIYPLTPYLSAVASTNESKDRLYLIVINKNFFQTMNAKININGGLVGDNFVQSWTLTGPSVEATNEGTVAQTRMLNRSYPVEPLSANFDFSFAPMSVTALEIKLQ